MAPKTLSRKGGVKKPGLSAKSSTKVAAEKSLKKAKTPEKKPVRISPRKSAQSSQEAFQKDENKLNVPKFIKAEMIERRDRNWDLQETEALFNSVKENWDNITAEHKGAGAKAKTEKTKKEAWENVTQLVNA